MDPSSAANLKPLIEYGPIGIVCFVLVFTIGWILKVFAKLWSDMRAEETKRIEIHAGQQKEQIKAATDLVASMHQTSSLVQTTALTLKSVADSNAATASELRNVASELRAMSAARVG